MKPPRASAFYEPIWQSLSDQIPTITDVGGSNPAQQKSPGLTELSWYGAPGRIRTSDHLVRSVPSGYVHPIVKQCFLQFTPSNKIGLLGLICPHFGLF